jgi:hypothetical protein
MKKTQLIPWLSVALRRKVRNSNHLLIRGKLYQVKNIDPFMEISKISGIFKKPRKNYEGFSIQSNNTISPSLRTLKAISRSSANTSHNGLQPRGLYLLGLQVG